MMRAVIIVALAVLAVGSATEQAAAKVKKHRHVHPIVRSYRAPAPLGVAPMSAAPAVQGPGPSSRTVLVPGAPPVVIPAAPPGRNSFSDRVQQCIHYGSAAGVQPNAIGPFTAQCAR